MTDGSEKVTRKTRVDPWLIAAGWRIIYRVDLLFERADAIEREVTAATLKCEWMTQAELGKAFSGKL